MAKKPKTTESDLISAIADGITEDIGVNNGLVSSETSGLGVSHQERYRERELMEEYRLQELARRSRRFVPPPDEPFSSLDLPPAPRGTKILSTPRGMGKTSLMEAMMSRGMVPQSQRTIVAEDKETATRMGELGSRKLKL